MQFIFMRHGETYANRHDILADDETDILKESIPDIESAARELKGKFDILISSPLKRAIQTAEIISHITGNSIEISEYLREKSFGEFIGKPLADIDGFKKIRPDLRDPRFGYNYQSWGGESGRDLAKRIENFIHDMRQRHPDKRILAITHAAVIRLTHILYGGREYKESFAIPNASTHEFEI